MNASMTESVTALCRYMEMELTDRDNIDYMEVRSAMYDAEHYLGDARPERDGRRMAEWCAVLVASYFRQLHGTTLQSGD